MSMKLSLLFLFTVAHVFSPRHNRICLLTDVDGRNERTQRRGQTPLRGSPETETEIRLASVGGNVALRNSAY